MIFVTVGTTEFNDLVKKIDELVPKLKLDVTIQIGAGSYEPKNCKWFRFETPLTKYFEKADIVITHGGAGTLFECLGLGKRIIAVPNPMTKDQHQLDIIEELSRKNHILMCKNLNELESCIKNKKKIAVYKKPECKIPDIIIKFLLGG